jgi:hypothetical protein
VAAPAIPTDDQAAYDRSVVVSDEQGPGISLEQAGRLSLSSGVSGRAALAFPQVHDLRYLVGGG